MAPKGLHLLDCCCTDEALSSPPASPCGAGDAAGGPPPSPSGAGDAAGGPPRQRISLGAPGLLPLLCRLTPTVSLFGSIGIFLIMFVQCPTAFYVLLSMLTAHVYCWIGGLAVFGAIGVHYVRRALARDWEAEWEQFARRQPGDAKACAHIVILPNYEEDEQMLRQTLDHIAQSPMAQEKIFIVLAMEAREGKAAEQKANALIKHNMDRFADIIATYHPANLPGEIAGKSANTQWAFREVQQRYAQRFSFDAHRVFVTVGDADTIWHPHYFTALALQGLSLSVSERCWALWQPPVFLLRNYLTVPGPVRVSGYAAFIYELSGLAGQKWWGTHLCYSAYSLTLALASHPLVEGWDTDVIAEDHHMFCKCYFASLWDGVPVSASLSSPLVPKVKLHPVYLPAVSYMVESKDGWLASCLARFQQARRHAQGISELAYTFLQYMRLVGTLGVRGLPLSTHCKILGIAMKMNTVHLTNTIHAFAVTLTMNMTMASLCMMISNGELWPWLTAELPAILAAGPGTLQGLVYWVGTLLLGVFSPLSVMMTFTGYLVMCDSLEGRLIPAKKEPRTKGAVASSGQSECTLAPWKRAILALVIWFDLNVLGESTIVLYGLLPEMLACISLVRRGNKFEYIVAAKPN